ncbi:MAG TPA: 50S ribosomal protein L10 [Gemmatimonadales bacterium]|jgi:large subunit ribosomal protein L10|nr:50S ribosomal protein L10 [Gemmatimonadales bacterium]
MSKIERHAEVAELTEAIKASPTLFVTDFSGLNVLKMTEFRRRIRAAGGRYVVVKNTLAQRALAANSIAALDDHLTGNTGIVFAGGDPMAAAKVIGEFAKEHEKPTVKAGWVDGKAVAPAYVKRLGEIPSREVLLGQFAGALNGVLYQVVGALEALREQRSASSAA